MSTRSTGAAGGLASALATVVASTVMPGMPRAAAFFFVTFAAARSDSTSTTDVAPRLAASRPSAPDPAYRSSTALPATTSRCSSRENNASRTRSLVGRVREPLGVLSRSPPARPPMIRVTAET